MTFRSEDAGAFERLTLDAPPLNTLDLDAVSALGERFRSRSSDRPLLITGAGRAFSAGVDVKRFAGYDAAAREAFFKAITAMTTALCATTAPVLAAVNGLAMGGGFVLALCADYRIATDAPAAKFGLTEAQAGVPFPAGPVEIVLAEVPPGLRRQMTLTSAILSAETLLQHGVFDETAPADVLPKRAKQRLADLAAQPAFSAVKAQIRGPLRARLAALRQIA